MKVKFNCDYQLSQISYKLGYTKETKFNFRDDSCYFVYGISIWNNALHYLLIEQEGDLPSWYPAEIFSCCESLLPINWHHKFYGYGNDTGIIAVWGYKELVESQQHYIGLLERESCDIEIFLQRKNEILA